MGGVKHQKALSVHAAPLPLIDADECIWIPVEVSRDMLEALVPEQMQPWIVNISAKAHLRAALPLHLFSAGRRPSDGGLSAHALKCCRITFGNISRRG